MLRKPVFSKLWAIISVNKTNVSRKEYPLQQELLLKEHCHKYGLRLFKLFGISLVDKTPSTDKLQNLVKKNVTCDT